MQVSTSKDMGNMVITDNSWIKEERKYSLLACKGGKIVTMVVSDIWVRPQRLIEFY